MKILGYRRKNKLLYKTQRDDFKEACCKCRSASPVQDCMGFMRQSSPLSLRLVLFQQGAGVGVSFGMEGVEYEGESGEPRVFMANSTHQTLQGCLIHSDCSCSSWCLFVTFHK